MSFFDGFRITSRYGWRTDPFTNKRAFHTGIDLVKSHQSPIHAFVEGRVIHAKEGLSGSGFGGYGIVVAIEDKKGSLHVYAHLDSVSVKVGQFVKRDQMIGRQGNTGSVAPKPTPSNPTSGSHLHYEIRKTSRPKFGWISDRANNCYEPLGYLRSYYAEVDEPKMTQRFKDVPEDHWAKESILKADKSGVLIGVNETEFGLGQAVTREQLAVALDRLGLLDKEVKKDD